MNKDTLDRQATFNLVWAHTLTMKKPSSNEIGLCLYRGPNGRKCLIGALIPDANYSEGMEGHDIANVLGKYFAGNPYSEDDTLFLVELQGVHDCLVGVKYADFNRLLLRDLRSFAYLHNLKVPA